MPTTEPIKIILPLRFLIIDLTLRLATLIDPIKFVLMMFSMSISSKRMANASLLVPALITTTSNGPRFFSISSIAASMLLLSVTSALTM